MAHFAKIDENNMVTKVLVVPDEQEHRGQAFLNEIGLEGTWIQTSYNGTIRKNFAGHGFSYDESLDAFIPPKPFESWILDENCRWEAPEPMPDNENPYIWDEESLSWKSLINS